MTATISTSIVLRDDLQHDGRRWIHELHTDSLGVQYPNVYMAPNVAWNATAQLAGNAANILAAAVAGEIASNIAMVATLGSASVPTFNYSTPAANAAALRLFYQTATKDQAMYCADYVNTLTNLQIQTAFGISAGAATTLRTNTLAPAAVLATSVRATVGQ